jgi:hypothetical protein
MANQLRRRRDKRFTLTGRGVSGNAVAGTGEMTMGFTGSLRIHTFGKKKAMILFLLKLAAQFTPFYAFLRRLQRKRRFWGTRDPVSGFVCVFECTAMLLRPPSACVNTISN